MEEKAKIWFENAKSNLRIAKVALEIGEFARAVENAQQAAEKAAKALLILAGALIEEHRIAQIFYDVFGVINKDMERVSDLLFKLEKHWLKSRYPLEREGKIWNPLKEYSKEDAEEAVKDAEEVLRLIKDFAKSNFGVDL